MLLNVKYSIIAENAVVDQQTNNISLINILNEVNLDFTQSVVPKEDDLLLGMPFTLVSFLEVKKPLKEKKPFQYKVSFHAPDGSSLHTVEQNFEYPVEKENLRTIMKFIGLPIKKESGIYTFKVFLKENKLYREVSIIPIKINLKLK